MNHLPTINFQGIWYVSFHRRVWKNKISDKFFCCWKKYLVLYKSKLKISIQYACLIAWHFNWKAQIVHPYLEFLKGILQETNILCPEGIQSYSQIVIGVSHRLLSISFSEGHWITRSGCFPIWLTLHHAAAFCPCWNANHSLSTGEKKSFANVTSVGCTPSSVCRILDPENLARHLGVPKNAGRNPVPPGMYPSRLIVGKNYEKLPSWLVQRICLCQRNMSTATISSCNLNKSYWIIMCVCVCVCAQYNLANFTIHY